MIELVSRDNGKTICAFYPADFERATHRNVDLITLANLLALTMGAELRQVVGGETEIVID